MRRVITSGYFDPLHVGHIELLEAARALGDTLLVIVNNDFQAALKKGKPFMRDVERARLVLALKCVDEVRVAFDTDRTVLKTLEWIAEPGDIFAKGGDSSINNVPERELCERMDVELRLGVGGGKIQSSSDLLSRYTA